MVFHLDQEHRDFIYRPFKRSPPQYSEAFVDWIVEQLKADERFLEKAREEYKRLMSK